MDPTDLIDELIAREGGYVANPADKGGPTCFGITQAVAHAHGYTARWRGCRALPRSRSTAPTTGKRRDFDQVAAVAPLVAAELFDTGVNMGVGTAAGFLRRALNALNALNRGGADYRDIAAAGAIDPAALAALKAFLHVRGTAAQAVLVKALDALQGERYLALAEQRPADEAFLYGWLANRVG